MTDKQLERDIIIVGAGPAGLALARNVLLKQPARRVLIIEREVAPANDPRIGESLPGAARILLDKLGLWQAFNDDNHHLRGAAVATWDSDMPAWQDGLRDPQGPGWHLDRRAFERMLLNGARELGAEFAWGQPLHSAISSEAQWQVKCFDQDNELHSYCAPILIDATGRGAHVARKLGMTKSKDDSLLCAHTFLPSPATDDDAIMRIAADAQGWWYSVKTPLNLRVLAYHCDAKDPVRQSLKSGRQLYTMALAQPLLASVLKGYQAYPASAEAAAPLCFRPAGTSLMDLNALKASAPGFLAVGDALMTFDPISSQGLFHALATAESAAKVVATDMHGSDNARNHYCAEMQAVSQRYLSHLQGTYQGPKRFAQNTFWRNRQASLRGESAASLV